MTDLPPDHPERLPRTIEFALNLIEVELADQRVWRIQIIYGDDGIVIGSLPSRNKAMAVGRQLQAIFEYLLRSDFPDAGQFTDMTAAAQALLDIRKEQWRGL